SLVQDMSQAVAHVALTGRLLALRSIGKENANGTAVFDSALLGWEADKAAIEARLQAYFPRAKFAGGALPGAWSRYGVVIDNLYYLSTSELPDRCQRVNEVMVYMRVSVAGLCCPSRPGQARGGERGAPRRARDTRGR